MVRYAEVTDAPLFFPFLHYPHDRPVVHQVVALHQIDLVTPRRLKGRELLRRTRGWWTAEPDDVAEVVEAHGRLVVGETGALMVELADPAAVDALSGALADAFGDQVMLSP